MIAAIHRFPKTIASASPQSAKRPCYTTCHTWDAEGATVTTVAIGNSALSPQCAESTRHRLFDDEGITHEMAEGRRQGSCLVPMVARDFRVPAPNDCDQLGRWAFVESTDPWDAERTLR